MEALVVVVVLDPGAADEGDPPVDDDDLAVIEMAEVVEPPVDPPLAQQAVEVEEAALVGGDLDPPSRSSRYSTFEPRPGWL